MILSINSSLRSFHTLWYSRPNTTLCAWATDMANSFFPECASGVRRCFRLVPWGCPGRGHGLPERLLPNAPPCNPGIHALHVHPTAVSAFWLQSSCHLTTRRSAPMKETVQQYMQRIQAKIAGKDPLRTQSETARRLAALLKRGAPARLQKRLAPDKWSVVEILAHLADVEMVTGWRLRSILAAPGTPIQAFDQDAWAAAGQYSKREARKSLEQFRILREANLAFLKSLTPEQRKFFGMHAERGQESIERLTSLMAGHDINHLEQIQSILVPKPRR